MRGLTPMSARGREIGASVALVVALLVGGATVAPPGGAEVGGNASTIVVSLTIPGGPGDDPGGGGDPTKPRPKPVTYIPVPVIRFDPVTGQSCLAIVNEPGDPNSAEALANETRIIQLGTRYPPCPGTTVPAVPSAASVVGQLWREQMQLPGAELAIAPGWAMVGRPAYLELGGATAVTRSFESFGYAITITATLTGSDVDWGDGTTTTGVRSAGGAWPHGDVTHVWTAGGTYDVRVTRRWTGVWRLNGGPPTPVPGALETHGTLPDFEARGYQAVRNR